MITITPDADLSNSQDYYCAIAAVEDSAGNENSGSNVTFTTESALIKLSTPSYPSDNSNDGIIGLSASAVSHASSYDFYYKLNTDSTYTLINKDNPWVQITGLTNGSTYDWYVVAKGDGVTYSDSDPTDVRQETPTASPSTPTFSGVTVDDMNSRVRLNFYRYMFADANASVPVSLSDLAVYDLAGGTATAVAIIKASINNYDSTTDVINVNKIYAYLSYTGDPDGNETFTVGPADGTSLYDVAGVPMDATHRTPSIATVAPGAEGITDGGIPAGTTAWIVQGGATLATDKCDFDNVTNGLLYQLAADMAIDLSSNTRYKMTFDVSISSGNANIAIQDNSGSIDYVSKAAYADGTHSVYFTTGYIYQYGIGLYGYNDSDNAFSITNVSIHEI